MQVPTGENLTFADENFIKYEETGVKEAKNAAFVLVAGGLGERLGYNGIKVMNLLHVSPPSPRDYGKVKSKQVNGGIGVTYLPSAGKQPSMLFAGWFGGFHKEEVA